MSTPIADNLNIPNDQWITASVSGTGNITGDRSQTLIANSAWSQVNGGVPFGTSFGSLVAVRNYRGGTSEIWNGYGGFASTYCGTESQSWNDPSIASYDARNLNGTRFTPHDPPGVPAPQLFSKPSLSFVMPPSLVEDAEAAAVEKGEESAIGRFLWSLVPGSSLVGAYRDYQKGDYVSAGLNGVSGLSDLLSLGTITKAKSSLKLLVGFMKVRVKDALADEAANQAGVAVAERLGPEAGFVTQIIVSATLSKNLSQQNKAQLGFANGVGKNTKGSYASKLLPIPQVLEPKLKNLVNDLYKGAKTPKPYGTGSTADAVRNELLTGLPTYGTFHFKKAQQYSIALRNWLRDKPKASYYDRLVAQSLLDDLMAALGGN